MNIVVFGGYFGLHFPFWGKMNHKGICSGSIPSRIALAGIICFYFGLAPISADIVPGQSGSGFVSLGEETASISVIAPDGFTWVLSAGTNNETSKSVTINAVDCDEDVYLNVYEISTPVNGEAGHMYSAAAKKSLKDPLFVGEKDNPTSMVALSSNLKRIYTFKDTPGIIDVPLDLGQAIRYTDPTSSDYMITVTFLVNAAA